MNVQVLHQRYPDDSCVIRVWVDGVEVTDQAEIEDLDPGRGYEQEDYQMYLEAAEAAAEADNAGEFERVVLDAVQQMRPNFKKCSYGDWS
jgi:hypothetical protein